MKKWCWIKLPNPNIWATGSNILNFICCVSVSVCVPVCVYLPQLTTTSAPKIDLKAYCCPTPQIRLFHNCFPITKKNERFKHWRKYRTSMTVLLFLQQLYLLPDGLDLKLKVESGFLPKQLWWTPVNPVLDRCTLTGSLCKTEISEVIPKPTPPGLTFTRPLEDSHSFMLHTAQTNVALVHHRPKSKKNLKRIFQENF